MTAPRYSVPRVYARKPYGTTLRDRVADLMAEEVSQAAMAQRLGVSISSVQARVSELVRRYGGTRA